MKKVHEYHQRAQECRALAGQARQAEHRTALIQMAETWENLARDREAYVARQGRIAALNEKIRQTAVVRGLRKAPPPTSRVLRAAPRFRSR
jgi:hypothetical protein